jgi:hypothetical protein
VTGEHVGNKVGRVVEYEAGKAEMGIVCASVFGSFRFQKFCQPIRVESPLQLAPYRASRPSSAHDGDEPGVKLRKPVKSFRDGRQSQRGRPTLFKKGPLSPAERQRRRKRERPDRGCIGGAFFVGGLKPPAAALVP